MVENKGIEELEKALNQTNTLKIILLKRLIGGDIRDFDYRRVRMGCKYWQKWPPKSTGRLGYAPDPGKSKLDDWKDETLEFLELGGSQKKNCREDGHYYCESSLLVKEERFEIGRIKTVRKIHRRAGSYGALGCGHKKPGDDLKRELRKGGYC
jgi:hypothetical protein